MAKSNKDKNSVETEEAFILRLPEVLFDNSYILFLQFLFSSEIFLT